MVLEGGGVMALGVRPPRPSQCGCADCPPPEKQAAVFIRGSFSGKRGCDATETSGVVLKTDGWSVSGEGSPQSFGATPFKTSVKTLAQAQKAICVDE